MAADRGLCAPDAPRGNAFTRAEKRCKNHEAETDDSEREADGAASARSLRRFGCMEGVHDRRNREECQRCEGPAALRFVHSHFAGPWPSMSAKKVRGSTRCAASCGQASTQLGSFKCGQRPHEVAFCLSAA